MYARHFTALVCLLIFGPCTGWADPVSSPDRRVAVYLQTGSSRETERSVSYMQRELEALIRAFEDESQAYTSLNLSMWSNRYGTYDDLARIKEWSAAGGLGIRGQKR